MVVSGEAVSEDINNNVCHELNNDTPKTSTTNCAPCKAELSENNKGNNPFATSDQIIQSLCQNIENTTVKRPTFECFDQQDKGNEISENPHVSSDSHKGGNGAMYST